jgi:hypothetical protein
MQSLFGNMNVGAFDAALKVFPKVFQPVHMTVASDIFLCAMLYALVFVTHRFQGAVRKMFIGVAGGSLFHVAFDSKGEKFIRVGYYIIGRAARMRGKWVWGQYAALIHAPDFQRLVKKAIEKGWIKLP